MALAAYANRMRAYPGDIVRDTLLNWPGKWFPAWVEIKEVLDGRVAARIAMRDALARLANAPLQIADDQTPAPPSIARLNADYDRLIRDAHRMRSSDPAGARDLENEAASVLAQIRELER